MAFRFAILLAVVLLVPGAMACSLVSAPSGPGALTVLDWQMRVVADVEVPDRGLGADCSIQVPHALGDGLLVWTQGTTLHTLSLNDGQRTERVLEHKVDALVFDEVGLLGIQQNGRGAAASLSIWALDGVRMDFIAERAAYLGRYLPWFEDMEDRSLLRHLRTGDILVDLDDVEHPEYESIAVIGTDGRYLVFEAHGEGTAPTVSLDLQTGHWQRLAIPAWGWNVEVASGVYYGVRHDAAWRVDLSDGHVTELSIPEGDVLAMTSQWVLTGAYAKDWDSGPGERIPAITPAAAAGVLAVGAGVAWRRLQS